MAAQQRSTLKRRRGRGEGSIAQRSDGRWQGIIDLGYEGKKRKRKYVYGKTRQDVVRKMRDFQQQHDAGINITPERYTVAQFLERWLGDVAPSVRANTHLNYERAVRLHIVPHIGRYALAKLTPEHVQQMLRSSQATLSPPSVRNVYGVLRLALSAAMRRELVTRNVVLLVDPPSAKTHRPTVFTPEHAQRFLDAIRGHRLEALFRMALLLGLRRGELIGLRWHDIDLERGEVRVNGSIQDLNGKIVRMDPKTEKSKRTLPLPASLVALLQHHSVGQENERAWAGSRWKEHDLVFPSKVGTPLTPHRLHEIFHRLLAVAGLPRMRLHDLRHSCATLLITEQRVSPRTVMELLGHTNLHTTMQIYAHVLDDAKRTAIADFDALFDTDAS